jgi:glycosyltransferase involved in cell wall biosynthesis
MNVALVDWNWMGHHPTYFVQFAAAMAEAGAEVVPFCPDPEDFGRRLEAMELEPGVRSRIFPATRLAAGFTEGFAPSRWKRGYKALRFFWGHGKRLRKWRGPRGEKIDLVFFACIYDWQFEHFPAAERLFGLPWSGLYLHARSVRCPGRPLPYIGLVPKPERLFSGPLLRSVALLDEGVLDRMKAITFGRSVFLFPDVTDMSLSHKGATTRGLAAKLKKFAGGRPIVSLLGHLQKTKGVEDFARLAQAPGMEEVVFFVGGEPSFDGVDGAAKIQLRTVWETEPNTWAHLQRLPEQSMNEVVAASDIIFAAYRDFPNSSNILTKAAVFRKPVLVSDGYLRAERVRKFGMGEVVPEGDIQAMAAAITRILANSRAGAAMPEARWQDYEEKHSSERLKYQFGKLLEASFAA